MINIFYTLNVTGKMIKYKYFTRLTQYRLFKFQCIECIYKWVLYPMYVYLKYGVDLSEVLKTDVVPFGLLFLFSIFKR